MEVLKTPTLLWGVASAPLPGQTESGDRFVVEPFADGALVGVIDALGHGHRASQVALQTVNILLQHPRDPVGSLVLRCHEALRGICGATMSLASLDWNAHRMTWLGVGNVAGALVRHSFHADSTDWPVRRLLVRGGVVGGDLPDLEAVRVALSPTDTLILATDGVDEQFADELPADLEPQPLAEYILARYAKGTDDALVLVARYRLRPDERGH